MRLLVLKSLVVSYTPTQTFTLKHSVGVTQLLPNGDEILSSHQNLKIGVK